MTEYSGYDLANTKYEARHDQITKPLHVTKMSVLLEVHKSSIMHQATCYNIFIDFLLRWFLFFIWKYLSPSLKNVLCLLFFHFNVWASLCRMKYVQGLTLEGCFNIHVQKRRKFLCANFESLGVICDITTGIPLFYAVTSNVTNYFC